MAFVDQVDVPEDVKDEVRSILTETMERITDPEHWCRQSGAVDANGKIVVFSDPKAVRFCAIYGLRRVLMEHGYNMGSYDGVLMAAESWEKAPVSYHAHQALGVAAFRLFDHTPMYVNDMHGASGHDDVLAMFRHALELI